MRRLIDAERSGDGIVGEEYGEKDGVTGRRWVLDPIDGTRSFTARPRDLRHADRAGRGRLAGAGRDRPAGAARTLAGRGGAPDDVQRRARADARLRARWRARCWRRPARICSARSDGAFPAARRGDSGGHPRQGPVYGGDCYNYGLVASGHLDLVCEGGLKLHDFAALVPVVEGAGGRMCDWNGDPLTAESEGHVLAIGDPARVDDVLEALHG